MRNGILKPVGVLIFVHEDVIELSADIIGEPRIVHRLRPVEQQVIVIEDILRLLGLDIESEQLARLLFPTGTPGIEAAQHVRERQFCIHGARIDRKAGGR